VRAAANRLAAVYGPDVVERAGYRAALVESAVVSNAALAAYTVQQEMIAQGLRATYGVWLIESREVWAPRAGSAECAGLAFPPDDHAAFAGFAEAVVRSDRIVALLGDGS